MQNYIYKTQYGQYDAKNNVETGYNKKYPFPQVQSCPLPSLTHKTKRTQADYLTIINFINVRKFMSCSW